MLKVLKPREVSLDKEQLKKYLAQIASSNTIENKSNIRTYPARRVKENCDYIYLVYKLLNEHVKMNIPIHPAGEWILDNYYLIEQTSKSILNELSKSKYKRLPGIKENGYARIYFIANEIVSKTDGKINRDDLADYLEAYQSQKYLFMEEIWSVKLFIQISIIEKIRSISEIICASQMQKLKAQNIVERIIENKQKKRISIEIEGKYSFIEYLSYKLKKYGDVSIPYIKILEGEIHKSGITIEEIIKREHFDIAIKTLSMKNCIISIKKISRLDISEIFKKVSVTENILCNDPADVYNYMDYKTKSYYRVELLDISKKTKLSEIYIANEILRICKEKKENNCVSLKETHIGYYLISDGKKELIERIVDRKIKFSSLKQKEVNYVISIYFFSVLITLLLINPIKISALFLYIPIQNTVTQIIQYIMCKKRKIRLIPKMDFTNGIPNDRATMCIIPSLLKSEIDVEKIFERMEVYYLANKTENLFFTLLGDCCESVKEKEKKDINIIRKGKELAKELNKKYGEKFFFIYRKRKWSESEKCFMGWERKRGLIVEFNDFLLTGKSDFLASTFNTIPEIKYVITLDSDTNLVLNTAEQLVGAMSHILNKPEVDKIKNIVTKGHAIIQPHIGIDIEDGRRTFFSRLFTGNGGTDIYSSAISDVYQDCFDQGIYTGKGIYDLKVFNKVLRDEIPEKKVLSHDLIEGNYLRCGLASDIVLMDGYPSNYNSYKMRMHRWIRGDIQVIRWLKSRLNVISKHKIIDNIVRNLNEKDTFLSFILLLLTMHKYLWVPFIVYSIPTIIKLLDNLINKKERTGKNILFSAKFSKWTQPIVKLVVDLFILPDIAFLQMDAICRACYRMAISKSLLLEWTTSDEAEKKTSDLYISYFKSMIKESSIAVLLILYLIKNTYKMSILNQTIAMTLSIMWFLSTIVMWLISKKNKSKIEINYNDKEYLLKIAKKTWTFFKENMVEGLPIDNYQENREYKQALRTSPTNIGLSLISTIASYDLKIENKEETINNIRQTITTVDRLQKWNGHLYNWYNLKNLEPMIPLDISSVDSGNFIGYLYVTKQFLKELKTKEVSDLIETINKIIDETSFDKLYNYDNGLFSIGYSVDQNKLYDSYYDLLASESRQTSLIAIAKKDIPSKHWKNLDRTLTKVGEHKGLISWGGTAFEYLMPNINIPTYTSTLIDESCKLVIHSNKEFAKKMNIPWGMSEAAYSAKDLSGNYQYKTFGIPWLGLKRGLEDNIVISPYSSALSLNIKTKESIQNLKRLEKEEMVGKYGFYESIDYKPRKEVIKTFMAHHQGMILASIDNVLNNNIIQKRFMKNPEISGIKFLLQENVPEDVIINKEKKEIVKKLNNNSINSTPRNKGINVISNGILSNMESDNGEGYTKFGDKTVYENVNIYLKNVNSNKIYSINNTIKNSGNFSLEYTPSSSKYIIQDGTISTNVKTTIVPNRNVEIRRITIENRGLSEIAIEVNTYTEPILQNKKDYSAHPTFNKMFFNYEYHEPHVIIKRKARNETNEELYLCTALYNKEGKAEFEIDKEKYITRNNETIPEAVRLSKQLSNKIDTVLNPIIAFRKLIIIKPKEKKILHLITSVGNNKEIAEKNLQLYYSDEKLRRVFELTREETEAESRYMGISEKEEKVYQEMAKLLLYSKQESFKIINKNEYKLSNLDLSNNNLWKYGISGEIPLIVIEIKEIGDYDLVNEVIKAYEYLKNKNIKFEVIIITSIDIKQQIISDKMVQYINKPGGFFILDSLKYDETRLIELRASILLDSTKGSLKVQIEKYTMKKNIEELSENNTYEPLKEENRIIDLIKTDFRKLNYQNDFGSFNLEGNEYWIKQSRDKRIPTAWSNILSNEKFGTVITDNQGGFTWFENSQSNRITRFDNDAYFDNPSEKIIIIGYEEKTNDFYAGFGWGYVHFINKYKEIEVKHTIFIPTNDSVKVNILQIKNNNSTEMNIDIKYNTDIVMAQDKNDSIIVEQYKKNLNMIVINNLMKNNYCSYITSNETIDKNKEIHVNLKPNEEREIVLLLGAEKQEMKCVEVATYYLNNYTKEFEKTKKYWIEKVKRITSKTPLESLDIMQNGFLVYQTLVSRMIGRTGYYQSSGGYGFRDQLQDAMGMKWIDPNILKNQILLHARHQFYEGDVEHWWHEDSSLGIRSRYSDDLLWLVYAVIEYIDFTGDYSILKREEPFIITKELSKDEVDKVDYYKQMSDNYSILEHCIRAIKKASNFGNHDLPLIGHGDWNDGMNKIGEGEKGESVWLGFFMYLVLTRFIKILKETEQYECSYYRDEIAKMYNTSTKIKKALNSTAWDGRWYIRAFDDNGEKIGSKINEECKIDSICQSFSVISKAGDNDKKRIAMESLENKLIDKENNLIRLLIPSLDKINLGYISSYSKGMRENGGQYTHAAIWAIIAETMLNKPDKAIEMYKMINPIEHTKSKEGIEKYKVEPYVIEADIYSEGKNAGRGGWTWYTGASGWLYEAQIRYILGIKIYHEKMSIHPCVPKTWKNFTVDFRWKEALYHLEYKQTGEYRINIEHNNERIENNDNEIELKNKGEFVVKIFF